MVSLTSLAADITTVTTWFMGLFADFFNTIQSQDLILWPIIFAIVAGVVGAGVLRVVRKFGIKGRR